MNSMFNKALAALVVLCLSTIALAQQPYRTETATPMAQLLKGDKVVEYSATSNYRAARISWPGDFATVHGERTGLYDKEGIKVTWDLQNDSVQQFRDMLAGKLHFGRFTTDQAVQAAPAFESVGGLVHVVQLTYSAGGDCLVADELIKTLKQLEGKRIALMVYGPHVYYVAKILSDAGVDLSKVEFVWMKELLQSDADTNGKVLSPYQAKESAPKDIQAVALIIPEADIMTGSEGVKGTHVLHSTFDSPNITADSYYVRGDFFEKNRDACWKFLMATLKSQEAYKDIVDANNAAADNKQSGNESEEYKALMQVCATDILKLATWQDGDAAVYDCRFAYDGGNRIFNTRMTPAGKVDFRNGPALVAEIVNLFGTMKLVNWTAGKSFPVSFPWTSSDFDKVAGQLRYPNRVEGMKFDASKAKAFTENLVNAELGNIDDLVSSITMEVSFANNQSEFPIEQYGPLYNELIQMGQTHAGSLIIVQGFGDSSMIEWFKARNKRTPAQIRQLEAGLNKTCYDRAQKVIDAFFAYCQTNNIAVNRNQYQPATGGAARGKVDIEGRIFPIIDAAVAKMAESKAAKDQGDTEREAKLRDAAQKQVDLAVEIAAPARVVLIRVQRVDAELGSIDDLMDGK